MLSQPALQPTKDYRHNEPTTTAFTHAVNLTQSPYPFIVSSIVNLSPSSLSWVSSLQSNLEGHASLVATPTHGPTSATRRRH